jgi:hypothetical protein
MDRTAPTPIPANGEQPNDQAQPDPGPALSPLRLTALLFWCLASVLIVPLDQWAIGLAVWGASALLVWRSGEPAFRRRLGMLLACTLLLGLAPIDTETSNAHFLHLGAYFAAAVLVPGLILARTDPGVVRFRLFPNRIHGRDMAYVAISIPVTWAGLRLYFQLSPEIARNWVLPPTPESEALWRLFLGVNAVGIWDELFFINTSFAILRSVFPFQVANLAQAVLYTAVLYDMAFTGFGPVFVYAFALTQGSLFERADNLVTVLIVHLIVDYFLFQEIVAANFPGLAGGWHFGL